MYVSRTKISVNYTRNLSLPPAQQLTETLEVKSELVDVGDAPDLSQVQAQTKKAMDDLDLLKADVAKNNDLAYANRQNGSQALWQSLNGAVSFGQDDSTQKQSQPVSSGMLMSFKA